MMRSYFIVIAPLEKHVQNDAVVKAGRPVALLVWRIRGNPRNVQIVGVVLVGDVLDLYVCLYFIILWDVDQILNCPSFGYFRTFWYFKYTHPKATPFFCKNQ